MWFYAEDLLQFLWKKQLFKNPHFFDLRGRSVVVLSPGIHNKNAGPDFENARIKIDGIELVGSVEIHIGETSWYDHNHHSDKSYNNVVLHVCYTAKNEVKSEDGNSIPTIALEEHIDISVLAKYQSLMDNQAFVACEKSLNMVPKHTQQVWFERMGVERLEAKTVYAESLLEKYNNDWNQLAYSLILRSFGMPLNTVVFEELAERLPFQLIAKHTNSVFQLEALLLGCAGLINTSDDAYPLALANEFAFLQAKYDLMPVQQTLKMGRMRPMSLPYVKLALFASFIHQNPDFKAFYTAKNLTPFFEQAQASEYWNTHYSFTAESSNKPKRFSQNAIRHLVLNAIAPFVFLYGKKKHIDVSVVNLLQGLKPENNSILTRWKSIGVKPESAFDGQALLHLYKNYCKPKRCLHCHIGQSLLSSTNG